MGLLLLTEEERAWLAEAVDRLHVPRSFLILEAVQAGFQRPSPPPIPGRRNKGVSFRLPAEVAEKIKQAASARGISQQSLIRHLLFTYITEIHPKTAPATYPVTHTDAACTSGGRSRNCTATK